MKACRGVELYLHSFLTPAPGEREVSFSQFGSVTHPSKKKRYLSAPYSLMPPPFGATHRYTTNDDCKLHSPNVFA
jgi:hypothetical protein